MIECVKTYPFSVPSGARKPSLYWRGDYEEVPCPGPPKHVVFSAEEAGQRVRGARGQGVTVELAKALGVTQSNVSEMERGIRGLTVHQVVKLGQGPQGLHRRHPERQNGPRERRALRASS